MPIFSNKNTVNTSRNNGNLFISMLLYPALWCLFVSSIQAEVYQSPVLTTIQQAQQGNLEAQIELAIAYEHGEGVDKDPHKAVQWYCQAALAGSQTAQRNLAGMFLNARGLDRDEALAVRWYRAAARSGDQFSEQMLARLDAQANTEKVICIKRPTPVWETARCSSSCKTVVRQVKNIAPHYNIDAYLVLAMIQQESNFKINVRSHKGAIGLMQLMPDTAKRFGVKDINDPIENIKGGIRYLKWLLKHYRGNVSLALAGYNAGENKVASYKGIPPYKETRNYVKQILNVYGKKFHPYQKDITMNTASTGL